MQLLAYSLAFWSGSAQDVQQIGWQEKCRPGVHCMQPPGEQPGTGSQQQCSLLVAVARAKLEVPFHIDNMCLRLYVAERGRKVECAAFIAVTVGQSFTSPLGLLLPKPAPLVTNSQAHGILIDSSVDGVRVELLFVRLVNLPPRGREDVLVLIVPMPIHNLSCKSTHMWLGTGSQKADSVHSATTTHIRLEGVRSCPP